MSPPPRPPPSCLQRTSNRLDRRGFEIYLLDTPSYLCLEENVFRQTPEKHSDMDLPMCTTVLDLPSWSLDRRVMFLLDSITIGSPLLDRIWLAIKLSRTKALPLSLSPPGTTSNWPIPSWKSQNVYEPVNHSGFNGALNLHECFLRLVHIFKAFEDIGW